MNIGKRERVKDLRTIWPKETDFSDWLSEEDGLTLIADDIGIEIEDTIRECRPGDYPCDIIGRKVGDENHVVVIENQFGRTNHDHLGKLLTYAAMNAAMTGIWISEVVSDDHRKVIDWLNDNTPTQVSFYLAEIQAYRINNSPVAPQLVVLCRPNLEVKLQSEKLSENAKKLHYWRKEMWVEISEYLRAQSPPLKTQSPSPDHWLTISLGKSGFHLNLLLVAKHKKIGCEIIISPEWKNTAYDQLFSQKEQIESQIGQPLQWDNSPDKKRARIFLEAQIDPKEPQNKLAIKNWMYDTASLFTQTFQSRIKNLHLQVSEADAVGEDEGESEE